MSSAITRRPLYGVVSPGETFAVNISPPVQVEVEHVTFLTLSKDVGWQLVKPDSVVVVNRSRLPMPFIVMVTPANVAIPAPMSLLASLKQWWAGRTKAP